MPAETTAFGEFFFFFFFPTGFRAEQTGPGRRCRRRRRRRFCCCCSLLLLLPPLLLLPVLGCPLQVDGARLEAVGGKRKKKVTGRCVIVSEDNLMFLVLCLLTQLLRSHSSPFSCSPCNNSNYWIRTAKGTCAGGTPTDVGRAAATLQTEAMREESNGSPCRELLKLTAQ